MNVTTPFYVFNQEWKPITHHSYLVGLSRMVSTSLLFLTIFCAVSALMFPGKCPTVPPSHNFPITKESKTLLYYLYVAPFSAETTSYLFRDIRTPERANYYAIKPTETISEAEFNYTIQLEYWNIEQGFIIVNSVAESHGDHVRTKSTVSLLNGEILGCQPVIQEEIRIWIKGKIFLIWSCVDLDDNARDEAVLVFYFYASKGTQYEGNMLNNITNSDVLSVAKEYVSPALLKTITIGKKSLMNINEKNGFLPFACPVSQINVAIPIGIILLFLGVIGSCWYLTN